MLTRSITCLGRPGCLACVFQATARHGAGLEAAPRLRGPRTAALAALLCAAAAAAMGCSSPSTRDDGCAETASGLETCPGSTVVRGIDVSTYQGTIVWSRVRAAGIGFAFARISDGVTAPDSQFAGNWAAMKVAGVLRGSYQYFRASEDPLAQASLVLSSLNDAGGLVPGDLPVVLDMETSDSQSNAMVQAAMTIWLDAVTRATGRPPIIYTSSATSSVIGSGFANYTLWVANWGPSCPTMPNGWSTWKFWQYSDTGAVSGVSGRVDLDEFDGPFAELLAFAGVPRADAADGSPGGEDGDAADAPNTGETAGGDAGALRPGQPCTR